MRKTETRIGPPHRNESPLATGILIRTSAQWKTILISSRNAIKYRIYYITIAHIITVRIMWHVWYRRRAQISNCARTRALKLFKICCFVNCAKIYLNRSTQSPSWRENSSTWRGVFVGFACVGDVCLRFPAPPPQIKNVNIFFRPRYYYYRYER